MDRSFDETGFPIKESTLHNGKAQRWVDGAVGQSNDHHEHWRPHANFNQNYRHLPERRPAVWNNSRHTVVAPLSRPEPANGHNTQPGQETSSCSTVTTAPSVDQLKNR